MSRTNKAPLTGKQLADMDFKHETRKAALIKARGVTGPVTDPEQAAYDLLAKSERFMVGTRETVAATMRDTFEFGKLTGKADGLRTPRSAGEQRARDQRTPIANILQEVFVEVQSAVRKHGPQHSPHEGYAVLAEEVDELWDEIKADRGRMKSARTEAVQAAAMAVRYVLDNDPH